MNILQLCKYYPPVLGGIELVEKTITRAHSELGDEVVISAFSSKSETSVGQFSEKIYFTKQSLFLKSAPISFSLIFQFKDLIARHKIERIYVHLPNPYMHEVLKFSAKFLKENHVEVVAVYHSDIVNQKYLGAIYNSYFLMNKDIYDLWICSSEKLWDSSSVLRKINLRKRRVIPFCTEGLLHYKNDRKFRGKLLAVGRLVPYKGFDFLIKALNNSSFELNIIGDGPEYEDLKSLAAKNVILHKRIDEEDKKKLYDECDTLIVSSINRAEAYGMIIVEAFEAGLPVVASDLESGVTFLVQNEITGLVFETKNKESLLHSLRRLNNDNDLYQRISQNSRKFYEEELSYEHFKNNIKIL